MSAGVANLAVPLPPPLKASYFEVPTEAAILLKYVLVRKKLVMSSWLEVSRFRAFSWLSASQRDYFTVVELGALAKGAVQTAVSGLKRCEFYTSYGNPGLKIRPGCYSLHAGYVEACRPVCFGVHRAAIPTKTIQLKSHSVCMRRRARIHDIQATGALVGRVITLH